ncbi:MAG: putative toxin-antitoxin system toxin component, PIN family [Kiritimatiellia bacterium]
MRVVLDTNVFVSGVFFSGPAYRILDAWRRGEIDLVVSPDILEEYRRVGLELAEQFKGVNLAPVLELLAIEAEVVDAEELPQQVCTDPDDDKFLACALAAKVKCICTGDKALLKTSGYCGIAVITPRAFIQEHLND